MLKIRLKRFGKKKEPSYRVVAADSRTQCQGLALAELGFYNPRTKETRLRTPEIVKLLKQGAQPTKTVKSVLIKAGVYDELQKPKLNVKSLDVNLSSELSDEVKSIADNVVDLGVNLKYPSIINSSDVFNFQVSITKEEASTEYEEPLSLNVLLQVDELIFKIKGDSLKTATLPIKGKSNWLKFSLVPNELGKGKISITLFQETAYIGNWELEAIICQEIEEQKQKKRVSSLVNLKSAQM
jgi:small subunit ribosomal protein S16